MNPSPAQIFPKQQCDWTRWIPAREEAAALLGLHPNSLSRKIREERWEEMGWAIYAAGPDGGQPKWWVNRDADARLSAGTLGEEYRIPAEFVKLPGTLQNWTTQKVAVVGELGKWISRERRPNKVWFPIFLDEMRRKFPGLRMSRAVVYKWHQVYRRPADIMKLVDGRGGHNKGGETSQEARSYFADLYLHQNQPDIKAAWRATKRKSAEEGWACGSYDAFRKHLDEWISPEKQLFHRDPDKWRKQMQPTIPQDKEAWEANECWVSDHVQLNVWVRFGNEIIRPWLTSFQDLRTRKICGSLLSPAPNTSGITGALGDGLRDERNMGGPAHVKVDNGKDYASYSLHGQTKKERRETIKAEVDEGVMRGLFNLLGIDVHFANPYSPNSKARLERWHRELDRFGKLFDTYCGASPDERPEGLTERLKNPFRVISFDDFRQRLDAHIEGYNQNSDHQIDDLVEDGVRLSPAQAMARWCKVKRVMADPKALDLLLCMWHKPVYVTRQGVAIRLSGETLHYGNFEPALMPFKALSKDRRRPVHVSYDPHDLRKIRVFDEQYRFVCECGLNEMGGLRGDDPVTIEHMKELHRQKAAYRKGLRHVAEHSLTSILSTEEHLAEVAAASALPRPSAPSAPLKLHQEPAAEAERIRIKQTPLDGQAREVNREQLREAVGAEGQSERLNPMSIMDRLAAASANIPLPAAAEEDVFASDPYAKLAAATGGGNV